jgi:3-hydroxyisobutyrate dehydrogenase
VSCVGVVGLGNMGSVLTANLVGAGHDVSAHDIAGPGRLPAGAAFASTVEQLAGGVDAIVLSLPDGNVSRSVAETIAATPDRRVRLVVDTSTIGPGAAAEVASRLSEAGVAYLDAPVSGGIAAARAGTLMVMYSGTGAACELAIPILEGLSGRRQLVGDRPGMAQALKLANNFLSATSLAATSEAISFLLSNGLDMGVALQVLNASSGQSAATSDKFPNQVLPGTFAAGFANNLMAKDVALYLAAVEQQHGVVALAGLTDQIWKAFAAAEPGADFTRIYPYVDGLRA